MSYPPPRDPRYNPPPSPDYHQQNAGPYGGYDQQQQGGYRQPERRRGDDGADTAVRIIRFVVGLVIGIFALHVVFVVFHANQGNGFVSTVYVLAKALVLGLGDVFTPRDAVIGVVLNYALAALLYLVVSQLIIKAIRRS